MLRVEGKYGVSDGGAHAAREPASYLDQAIGIAHCWRGFEQEQAKGGEVDAYAERKNKDCGERKTRRPAKKTESVTKVLKQAVEPAPSPDFTRGLDQPQLPAEHRIDVGFRLRHHFAMAGHLFR